MSNSSNFAMTIKLVLRVEGYIAEGPGAAGPRYEVYLLGHVLLCGHGIDGEGGLTRDGCETRERRADARGRGLRPETKHETSREAMQPKSGTSRERSATRRERERERELSTRERRERARSTRERRARACPNIGDTHETKRMRPDASTERGQTPREGKEQE